MSKLRDKDDLKSQQWDNYYRDVEAIRSEGRLPLSVCNSMAVNDHKGRIYLVSYQVFPDDEVSIVSVSVEVASRRGTRAKSIKLSESQAKKYIDLKNLKYDKPSGF